MFLASVLCLQSRADASLRRMLHRANRVRLGSVKVGLNSRKWCEMHVPGAMGLYFCGTPLCYRGVPLARILSIYTDPGTTALYRVVMIMHATLWLLLCGAAEQRKRKGGHFPNPGRG